MRYKFLYIKKAVFTIKGIGRKTITLYENYIYFIICPIFYFVAIAFAYNAFYPKLIFAGLTPYTLYSFSSLNGRIIIDFAFKDNILKILVFRYFIRFIKGIYINPIKALSANSISY